MKKLRLRLARWIAPRGYYVAESLEHVVSTLRGTPTGAGSVVETDGLAPRWTPKQEGGVVVAEPLIVSKARRAGENVDDVS